VWDRWGTRPHNQAVINAMGHYITAIIGKSPIEKNVAVDYDLPYFEHNDFVIVALDEAHSDYWAEKLDLFDSTERQVILDCKTTHFFAKAIGLKKYAIINTDYFGGAGEQFAAVYENGEMIMPTKEGAINEALKMLGVKCIKDCDEFDSICLGNYRNFDDFFDKYYDDL
jgi:hypothetical protein